MQPIDLRTYGRLYLSEALSNSPFPFFVGWWHEPRMQTSCPASPVAKPTAGLTRRTAVGPRGVAEMDLDHFRAGATVDACRVRASGGLFTHEQAPTRARTSKRWSWCGSCSRCATSGYFPSPSSATSPNSQMSASLR